jgi:flagellar hook-basal body complex protein FliE
MFLPASQAMGHQILLQQTDPHHLGGVQPTQPENGVEASFGRMFLDALSQVNEVQHRAMTLEQQMVTSPESVDVHDVTIAIAEANLAISTTKAVVDGAIRAYQEITNLR